MKRQAIPAAEAEARRRLGALAEFALTLLVFALALWALWWFAIGAAAP